MKSMLSPYCRQGNKYRLRNLIIPLLPEHKIYVEPFAGGANIFFNKDKADKNVLNDLDKDVYDRLIALQKAPLDKDKYVDLKNLDELKKFYINHSNSVPDQIIYHKIKSCYGFGGKTVTKPSEIYPDIRTNSPSTIILKNLEEYKEKLNDVIIKNESYESVINQYDSPETLFFLDPPYENTNKIFYKDTDFDFNKLSQILSKIKGKFFLTLNDSPNIRMLFKNFKIKSINATNTWYNNKNNIKMFRKELFITNY